MFPNLIGQIKVRHLSDENVANMLGISRQTFVRKLKNATFTIKEAKFLSKYFNKTFEFLFDQEEE